MDSIKVKTSSIFAKAFFKNCTFLKHMLLKWANTFISEKMSWKAKHK